MKKADEELNVGRDSNPDPITGEPGAHPLGVAGGGSGGAVAGAAIGGVVGGPVGAIVGGAIGAVAGGLIGKGAAEELNPTVEDAHWRSEYARRPYYRTGLDYETHYQRAYRHGWESAARPNYTGRNFEQAEPDLERDWATFRGPSTTEWRDVRDATRDSYDRIRTRNMARAISDAGKTRAISDAGKKSGAV